MTDRDGAANSPNALLTLVNPRADTPATLDAVSTLGASIAPALPKTPAQLAEPITESSVIAFLQIATIQHLKMTTDPGQRQAIINRSKTITTHGQAYDYLREVTQCASAYRAAVKTGVIQEPPPSARRP